MNTNKITLPTSGTIVFTTAGVSALRLRISTKLNSHTLCSWPFINVPIRLQLYVAFSVCEEKLILCVFEFPKLHGDIICRLSDKSRRSGLLSFCWPKFIGLFADKSGSLLISRKQNLSSWNHTRDQRVLSWNPPYWLWTIIFTQALVFHEVAPTQQPTPHCSWTRSLSSLNVDLCTKETRGLFWKSLHVQTNLCSFN